MFLTPAQVEDGAVIEADLCIVGAGPAGITLAAELDRLGVRIVLVESGGMDLDNPQDFPPGSRQYSPLNDGPNVGYPYSPLASRIRYFGGTSNFWGGACRPLDELDFEQRPWVPHSGWPFQKSELDPYYARAHVVLDLGPYNYDPDFWRAALGQEDRPFLFQGSDLIEKKIWQVSALRGDMPLRRDYNPTFRSKYRDAFARSTTTLCLVEMTALELESQRDGQHVSAVLIGSLGGKRATVAAKHYVLAQGGLEVPRLLLLSNTTQPKGLGNQNDLVGRYFMEHAFFRACEMIVRADVHPELMFEQGGETPLGRDAIPGLSPEDPDGGAAVRLAKPQVYYMRPTGVGLTARAQRRHRLLNFSIMFFLPLNENARQPGGEPLAETGTELRSDLITALDAGRSVPLKRFDGYCLAELAPNPDSRVTLSDQDDPFGKRRLQLDWRIADFDRASMRRAMLLLGSALASSGAGRLRILPDAHLSGAMHHMGTTRMHPDPRSGVVDADARVHGIDNLYIASSSVFPTGGFANSTLTIVAMTLRLADHLKARLRT